MWGIDKREEDTGRQEGKGGEGKRGG